MKKLFIALTFISFSALGADIGLNTSSLKLKVYKFAVSESEFCTDLTVVIDNGDSPKEVDFLNNPDLGKGDIKNGKYKCVVIEMSDRIKFTPEIDSDSGNCQADTEEIMDICHTVADEPRSTTLVNGDSKNCSENADKVALYLSTSSTGTGQNAFNPPSADELENGLTLGDLLKVAGKTTGKFIVNADGQVCDGDGDGCAQADGTCGIEAPEFSFEKIED